MSFATSIILCRLARTSLSRCKIKFAVSGPIVANGGLIYLNVLNKILRCRSEVGGAVRGVAGLGSQARPVDKLVKLAKLGTQPCQFVVDLLQPETLVGGLLCYIMQTESNLRSNLVFYGRQSFLNVPAGRFQLVPGRIIQLSREGMAYAV